MSREIAEKILTTCKKKSDSMIGAFALNLEVSSYLWDAAPQLAQAYLDVTDELERLRAENTRLRSHYTQFLNETGAFLNKANQTLREVEDG